MKTGRVYYVPQISEDGILKRGVILEYNTELCEKEDDHVCGRILFDMREGQERIADLSKIGKKGGGQKLLASEFTSIPKKMGESGYYTELAVDLGGNARHTDIIRDLEKKTQVPKALIEKFPGKDKKTGIHYKDIINELTTLKKRSGDDKEIQELIKRLEKIKEQIIFIRLLERASNRISERLTLAINSKYKEGDDLNLLILNEVDIRKTLLTSSVLNRLLKKEKINPILRKRFKTKSSSMPENLKQLGHH
jgi:hypothetical protein